MKEMGYISELFVDSLTIIIILKNSWLRNDFDFCMIMMILQLLITELNYIRVISN